MQSNDLNGLDLSGVRFVQQNSEKIKESAQNLTNQPLVRITVIEKQKKNYIPIIIGTIAVSVITVYGFLTAAEKEFENQARFNANYVAEHYAPRVSDETAAEANKNYAESFYSADNINKMKTNVLNDYDALLDDISANLKINNDEDTLKRQYNALTNYKVFKSTNEENKVDYNNASENERLTKANDLYNEDLKVLEAQLTEAIQKGKYLERDSAEELANAGKIADINISIGDINEAKAIMGGHSLTIDQGKQK
jgi:hypothetical protein